MNTTNFVTDKQFLKDALGWGFILWLIGYALGMMLFAVVPVWAIGWIVTPIGIIITLWVLIKKVQGNSLGYYVLMALIWLVIAVAFDYIFLIAPFNLVATYYKLDVYAYYGLTFLLPVVIGIKLKYPSVYINIKK